MRADTCVLSPWLSSLPLTVSHRAIGPAVRRTRNCGTYRGNGAAAAAVVNDVRGRIQPEHDQAKAGADPESHEQPCAHTHHASGKMRPWYWPDEAAPQAAATRLRDGQLGQPAWTLCGQRLTCGIVSDGVGEPLMASRGVGQFSHLVEASLGGIPLSRDDAFSVLGTQDRDVTKPPGGGVCRAGQIFWPQGQDLRAPECEKRPLSGRLSLLFTVRDLPSPDSEVSLARARRALGRRPASRGGGSPTLLHGRERPGPAEADIQHLTQAARAIKRQFPDLELCLSLGLTSEDQARALKAAGVGWVNHNLNTSRRFYPAICSTHTYDDRVETVRNVRRAGLMTCSGGIIGMGESDEDVVDMAFAVRELEVDSIPVNFLHPIPGTPLADVRRLSPAQGLKALCLFRFLNPRSEIRMAAGREEHLKDSQFLALYAANSIFVEGYLTTPGQKAEDAKRMIVEAGFEIEGETV